MILLFACDTGGFSEPHNSMAELIDYHHYHPIEIIGKEHVLLRDPVPRY